MARFTRPRLILFSFVALALAAIAVFSIGSTRSQMSLGENQLDILTSTGAHRFTVELAMDDRQRARGLMYRTELAPDHGMLFDFERDRPVSMWMRNTYIPLDMLFIRSTGQVVNIAQDTVPLSEKIIDAAAPVRFVLEVPAGTAKRIGAKAGDRVRHAWIVE